MSCEYCKDDYTLIDTATKISRKSDCWPGITVGVENGELWVSAIADTYEPSCQEAFCKINFCPMCGEKLNKE